MAKLKQSGARAQAHILNGSEAAAGTPPAVDAAKATSSGWDTISADKNSSTFEELLRSPFERTLRGPSGRVYTGTSCGLLIWMPPRRHCILMVENKSFDNFILLVILMNCITMAWESPLDPTGTWKADFIDGCEVSARLVLPSG